MKSKLYDIYHLLPDSITRPIDCRRRRKYWRAYGTIFIHVPKAAGTSISFALYGRSLGHFKAIEIANWCPEEYAKLHKFAFVRNPWDRAVSAYRFALEGSTATAGIRDRKQYKVNAFRSFEAFVYEWLSDKDLTKLDNVFQPQGIYIADEKGKFMIDFLGKVESFEKDLETVSCLIGKSLLVWDLNRISRIGSYTKYYHNSELINKVGDIYSGDVDLFGYDYQ